MGLTSKAPQVECLPALLKVMGLIRQVKIGLKLIVFAPLGLVCQYQNNVTVVVHSLETSKATTRRSEIRGFHIR